MNRRKWKTQADWKRKAIKSKVKGRGQECPLHTVHSGTILIEPVTNTLEISMGNEWGSEQLVVRQSRLAKLVQRLYLPIACLNLPLAIGIGIVAYTFAPEGNPFDGGPSMRYYVRRASFRVAGALHVIPFSKTHDHFGGEWIPRYLQLQMVAVPISAVLAAILLWALVARVRVPLGRERITYGLVGLSALLAAPAAVLLARYYGAVDPVHLHARLWVDPLFRLFLGELLALLFLYVISGRKTLSLWVSVPLVSLHCLFWMSVSWGLFAALYLSLLTVIVVFPVASLVWLLRGPDAASESANRPTLRSVVLIAVAVILAAIWIPLPGTRFKDLRDRSSVAVTIERTTCFGPCPAYSVTVHGNGVVDYVGKRFVGTIGPAESRISPDQVTALFEALDAARFSSLDDRAFDWCFDTPFVAVTVSDHRTERTVWSDAGCGGPRDGPQRHFLELTMQIDQLASARQWVECKGQRFCR